MWLCWFLLPPLPLAPPVPPPSYCLSEFHGPVFGWIYLFCTGQPQSTFWRRQILLSSKPNLERSGNVQTVRHFRDAVIMCRKGIPSLSPQPALQRRDILGESRCSSLVKQLENHKVSRSHLCSTSASVNSSPGADRENKLHAQPFSMNRLIAILRATLTANTWYFWVCSTSPGALLLTLGAAWPCSRVGLARPVSP